MINKVVIIHYLAHQILTNKQTQPIRNEPRTSENENSTQANTARPKKQNKHYQNNRS